MKSHFEEEDLVCGKILIRNTSDDVSKNPGFAMSVAFMVGYRSNQTITLISIADGWVQKFKTPEDLVKELNEDPNGYRVATRDEVFRMMAHKYQNETSVPVLAD